MAFELLLRGLGLGPCLSLEHRVAFRGVMMFALRIRQLQFVRRDRFIERPPPLGFVARMGSGQIVFVGPGRGQCRLERDDGRPQLFDLAGIIVLRLLQGEAKSATIRLVLLGHRALARFGRTQGVFDFPQARAVPGNRGFELLLRGLGFGPCLSLEHRVAFRGVMMRALRIRQLLLERRGAGLVSRPVLSLGQGLFETVDRRPLLGRVPLVRRDRFIERPPPLGFAARMGSGQIVFVGPGRGQCRLERDDGRPQLFDLAGVIVLRLLQGQAKGAAIRLVLLGHRALARFGRTQRAFDFRQTRAVPGNRGFELLLCGLGFGPCLSLEHRVAFRGVMMRALRIRQLLLERRGAGLVSRPVLSLGQGLFETVDRRPLLGRVPLVRRDRFIERPPPLGFVARMGSGQIVFVGPGRGQCRLERDDGRPQLVDLAGIIVLRLLQGEAKRATIRLVLLGHRALARFGRTQRAFDFRQTRAVPGNRGFELLLCGLGFGPCLSLEHRVAFRGVVMPALRIRQLLLERRGAALVSRPVLSLGQGLFETVDRRPLPLVRRDRFIERPPPLGFVARMGSGQIVFVGPGRGQCRLERDDGRPQLVDLAGVIVLRLLQGEAKGAAIRLVLLGHRARARFGRTQRAFDFRQARAVPGNRGFELLLRGLGLGPCLSLEHRVAFRGVMMRALRIRQLLLERRGAGLVSRPVLSLGQGLFETVDRRPLLGRVPLVRRDRFIERPPPLGFVARMGSGQIVFVGPGRGHGRLERDDGRPQLVDLAGIIVLRLLQGEAKRAAIRLVLLGHRALARFGRTQRAFDFRQAREVLGNRGFELLLRGLDLGPCLSLEYRVAFRGVVMPALRIRQLLLERRDAGLVSRPVLSIRVAVRDLRAQSGDFGGMRGGTLLFAGGGFDDRVFEAEIFGDVAECDEHRRRAVGRHRVCRRVQLQPVRESAEPGEFDFRGPAVAGRHAGQEHAARLSRPRRDHVEQRRIERLFETLGTEHRQRGVVDG